MWNLYWNHSGIIGTGILPLTFTSRFLETYEEDRELIVKVLHNYNEEKVIFRVYDFGRKIVI